MTGHGHENDNLTSTLSIRGKYRRILPDCDKWKDLTPVCISELFRVLLSASQAPFLQDPL